MAEGNNTGEGAKQESPPSKELLLVIKYHEESGELTVAAPGNGTLYDEPICLWLLYRGLQFIENANMKARQSKLVLPNHKPRLRDKFPWFNRH